MPDRTKLITVFEEARTLLALPANDFLWSFWEDADEALKEIDDVLATLRGGDLPDPLGMRVLFAPTGPIQEVGVSSGWGDAFIALADRFDDALIAPASADAARLPDAYCGCLAVPSRGLTMTASLGFDDDFAEISVQRCDECGRYWLRYFYEVEAFTGSGRWYLGAITPEQLADLTAERARSVLEGLEWYFYGGSYFGGTTGRTSGTITPGP